MITGAPMDVWGTCDMVAIGFVVTVLPLFFKGECDNDELCAGCGSVKDFETRICGAVICLGGLLFTC